MSLYQVQKLIYQLNRDPRTRERYAAERIPLFSDIATCFEALRALYDANAYNAARAAAKPEEIAPLAPKAATEARRLLEAARGERLP